jgi:Flp pilus assembly protein TadG
MILRLRNRDRRRGMSLIEAAIVYPTTLLLMIGTVVLGLGVYRYQQLMSLAREGARYASVHGPAYAAANSTNYASNSTVLSAIEPLATAGGLQTSNLSCTVTWTPSTPTTSPPSTVTVAVTYDWVPEAYFSSVTWTVSSTMPVSY